MRARRRVIGTRCSVRAPVGAGNFTAGAGFAGLRRRSLLLARHVLNHIALGDAAVAAAAGDLRRRRACSLRPGARAAGASLPPLAFACRRRSRGGGSRLAGRLRLRGLRRLRGARPRRRLLRAPRAPGRSSPSRRSRPSSSLITPADRRRHFEHDLVGLEVDEILVAADRLARPSCARRRASRRRRTRAAAEL